MYQVPQLAALRRAQVLTQEELATRAGVQKKTVHRLERGGQANAKTVRKLAPALGVEPGLLVGEPDR